MSGSRPAESARWALVRSVAKFLGPDLRVALVAADEVTAARLHARLGPATTWVSHLLQRTVRGLLSDPETEVLRQTARRAHAERSASLLEALRERRIAVAIAPDGLNVWIELDVDAAAAVEALAARGWQVRPSGAFAVGQSGAQQRGAGDDLDAHERAGPGLQRRSRGGDRRDEMTTCDEGDPLCSPA
jgi:DNA-binding transcriptional MocR family regulator